MQGLCLNNLMIYEPWILSYEVGEPDEGSKRCNYLVEYHL